MGKNNCEQISTNSESDDDVCDMNCYYRFYLTVSYAEKDLAKRYGAMWDKDKKKWYIMIQCSSDKYKFFGLVNKETKSEIKKLEDVDINRITRHGLAKTHNDHRYHFTDAQTFLSYNGDALRFKLLDIECTIVNQEREETSFYKGLCIRVHLNERQISIIDAITKNIVEDGFYLGFKSNPRPVAYDNDNNIYVKLPTHQMKDSKESICKPYIADLYIILDHINIQGRGDECCGCQLSFNSLAMVVSD
jgi:hypothetical protein